MLLLQALQGEEGVSSTTAGGADGERRGIETTAPRAARRTSSRRPTLEPLSATGERSVPRALSFEWSSFLRGVDHPPPALRVSSSYCACGVEFGSFRHGRDIIFSRAATGCSFVPVARRRWQPLVDKLPSLPKMFFAVIWSTRPVARNLLLWIISSGTKKGAGDNTACFRSEYLLIILLIVRASRDMTPEPGRGHS